jgi:hypothetical protein
MNEAEVVAVVVALNACVLGLVFFALYQANKAVKRSGR